MIAGRNLSLGSVAVLACLSASFGAWSAVTGPAVAEVQLSDAAQNLSAATSFVEVADETEAVIGTADQEQVRLVADSEGADRLSVNETVRVTTAARDTYFVRTLTQVGSSCWAHSTGGRPLLPCGDAAQQRFHEALRKLQLSSGVTDSGGTYFLNPQDSTAEIQTLSSGQLSIGMPSVEVRIAGDTISWERVSFLAGVTGGSVLIDDVITFTDVDHGPAVVAPPGPPTATIPAQSRSRT
jgi:hypothetical protein